MGKLTRREMLMGGVAALAATTLPAVVISRSMADSLSLNNTKGDNSMATITTKDGATIFYKDWDPRDAEPIVFHHGWPLSSDDWDAQMLFFLANGYRVVAHDRRGHGRSSQVATGHDMDQTPVSTDRLERFGSVIGSPRPLSRCEMHRARHKL